MRKITLTLEATPVPGTLIVTKFARFDGVDWLQVDIDPDDPYGSFKKLPAAVEFQGRIYGKTAFDSDRNIASYKTDAHIARAVR